MSKADSVQGVEGMVLRDHERRILDMELKPCPVCSNCTSRMADIERRLSKLETATDPARGGGEVNRHIGDTESASATLGYAAEAQSPNELLPCPFCGEAPRLSQRTPAGGEFNVRCVNTACVSPSFFSINKHDLIDTWNTRAPDKLAEARARVVEAPRRPRVDRAPIDSRTPSQRMPVMCCDSGRPHEHTDECPLGQAEKRAGRG